MIYKPKGVTIAPPFVEKIRKEYTNPRVCYIFKNTKVDRKWNYSTISIDFDKVPTLLDPVTEALIYFDKGVYYNAKPCPTNYRPPNEEYDDWFISIGGGLFSGLSGAADKGPDIIFENFLTFLNSNSLHRFLENFTEQHGGHFATASREGIKMYGRWFEKDGALYSNLDFANKLTFDAKSMLKAILAFCFSPTEFKPEIERLARLSDYELRQLCEKNEQTKKILEQIG